MGPGDRAVFPLFFTCIIMINDHDFDDGADDDDNDENHIYISSLLSLKKIC